MLAVLLTLMLGAPPAQVPARLTTDPLGRSGTLTILDQQRVRWSATTPGLACVKSTLISPDAHFLLAFADGCGYVQLWDMRSGTRLATYPAPQYRLLIAAFTPDSRRFLLNYIPGENHTGFDTKTGFTWPWGESSLWTVTGKRVAIMSKRDRGSFYVQDVHFSGDGRRMVFTDGSDPASVWDALTGAYLQTLPRLGGRGATNASLNRDGSRATVVFADGRVATFDVKTANLLRSTP